MLFLSKVNVTKAPPWKFFHGFNGLFNRRLLNDLPAVQKLVQISESGPSVVMPGVQVQSAFVHGHRLSQAAQAELRWDATGPTNHNQKPTNKKPSFAFGKTWKNSELSSEQPKNWLPCQSSRRPQIHGRRECRRRWTWNRPVESTSNERLVVPMVEICIQLMVNDVPKSKITNSVKFQGYATLSQLTTRCKLLC